MFYSNIQILTSRSNFFTKINLCWRKKQNPKKDLHLHVGTSRLLLILSRTIWTSTCWFLPSKERISFHLVPNLVLYVLVRRRTPLGEIIGTRVCVARITPWDKLPWRTNYRNLCLLKCVIHVGMERERRLLYDEFNGVIGSTEYKAEKLNHFPRMKFVGFIYTLRFKPWKLNWPSITIVNQEMFWPNLAKILHNWWQS